MKQKNEYIAVAKKYFDRIQHYKNSGEKTFRSSTVWLKLHFDLLDDINFCQLEDQSKWHFLGFLILSLKLDNKIPFDLRFLQQKLSTTSEINFNILLKKQFLEKIKPKRIKNIVASKKLATSKQTASLEKEKEEEKEQKLAHAPMRALICARGVCGECSEGELKSLRREGYKSIFCKQIILTYAQNEFEQNSTIKDVQVFAEKRLKDAKDDLKIFNFLESSALFSKTDLAIYGSFLEKFATAKK